MWFTLSSVLPKSKARLTSWYNLNWLNEPCECHDEITKQNEAGSSTYFIIEN